jgi:hypothetical protein
MTKWEQNTRHIFVYFLFLNDPKLAYAQDRLCLQNFTRATHVDDVSLGHNPMQSCYKLHYFFTDSLWERASKLGEQISVR